MLARFADAGSSLARERGQRNRLAVCFELVGDGLNDRRLSRARAAVDDGQARGCSCGDGAELGGVEVHRKISTFFSICDAISSIESEAALNIS